MMREPAFCGAREGIAFTLILLLGLAFAIVPAAVVLVFLLVFWVLEILCWIALTALTEIPHLVSHRLAF